MLVSLPLIFSSNGWFGSTLMRTPSESGLSKSLPTSFTSNEKLMLEQFLNGIFMTPLLGILIILTPDLLSSNSLRQTIWGTSPLLWMEMISGDSSSICSSKVPLISVDVYSSGMLVLTNILMISLFLSGIYSSLTSSPFYTALTVKILSRLKFWLLANGSTRVFSLSMWNSRRWCSPK